MKKKFIVLFSVILFLSIGLVYKKDYQTAKQAITVREFLLQNYKKENKYPTEDLFWKNFLELKGKQWYYWPSNDLAQATFQYPMNIPVWGAPGKSKFSEFLPVIYSFTVRNPHTSLFEK